MNKKKTKNKNHEAKMKKYDGVAKTCVSIWKYVKAALQNNFTEIGQKSDS